MRKSKVRTPIWGVTRKGVIWSATVFIISSGLALLGYANIETFPFYWEHRLLTDLSLLITPTVLAFISFVFWGFYAREIEWRPSERGVGWSTFIMVAGILIACLVIASMPSEKVQVTTILLAFGTPLILSLIPFFYWGFQAIKWDKENRRRYPGA